MNGLIQELTNELQNNKSINNSIASKVVLESITNSQLLGVAPDQILENSLNTLEQFANELVNENLKDVVARFKKMAEKPTQRLHNMAKEAGLSIKLKAIKESSIYSDPVVKHSVARVEEALASVPEYKAIGHFIKHFSNFAYDSTVQNVLESLTKYINENRAKLEILNAVHDMRTASSIMYKDTCDILESALLENITSADSLRMKLRSHAQLPIVSSLLNKIGVFEAKDSGDITLGTGNGDSSVKPVIAPFYVVSEGSALIFVDNKYIKVSENSDPVQVSEEEVSLFPEFMQTCEAFRSLGFKQSSTGIVSENRNLKVAFGLNESGTLSLKINDSIVENIKSVNFGNMFLMESIQTRTLLSKLFENLDLIVNLEFAKSIVNERLGKNAIVLNFGENIFVLEKLGEGRLIKKMKGLTFHNYVMENFRYDISEMYEIELEEKDAKIKELDSEKSGIEGNLKKLESSISKIEEALADSSISADYQEKLNELKRSIEKNVNSLKSQYILIDQAKKKF